MSEGKANESLSRLDRRTWTRKFTRDYQYYSLGLLIFLFSLFIHSTCPFCPGEYSDLNSLFFQVFEDSGRWFSGTVSAVGIPYVDYRFEYPPVVGSIFYVSSVASLDIARWAGVPRETVFLNMLVLVFILPAYLVYLKTVNSVSKVVRADRSRLFFAAAGFGIAYYVVYNFDIIAVSFAMFSLLLLIRGNARSAGVLLAMSVASKVVTGVILLPSLLYLARRSIRSAVSYFLCFLLTMGATFGPVYVLSLIHISEPTRPY